MHLLELFAPCRRLPNAGNSPAHSAGAAPRSLEATCRVEARGEFVGDSLVVDEAVYIGRADGAFVQAHRVKIAAVDPRDLAPISAARFSKFSGQCSAHNLSCG